MYDPKQALWRDDNWRAWPHCASAQDQGADGVTGWHGCAYHYSINTTAEWDESHGSDNDANLAINSVGLKQLFLLIMIAINLPRSPARDEGMRYQQLGEALGHLFSSMSPDSCSLFRHHAQPMREELGATLEVSSAQDQNLALWDYLRLHHPYKKK